LRVERASRILEDEGIDKAIDYLEGHNQTSKHMIDLLDVTIAAEQKRLYQLLDQRLLEASSHDLKLDFDNALQIRETVVFKARHWFRGRVSLGSSLMALGRFSDAEPHLAKATELAENDKDRATSFSNLGAIYRAYGNRQSHCKPK
jgi:Flp pilus assembly protein TadD